MEHVEKPDHSRDWKIASIRKKLAAATQEILVAKQHVVDLEEQAGRIKEDLNSLSAAIMCLPPEILIEIFLLLCEDRPIEDMKDMEDLESFCSQHPPQFPIGAVCRTWRRIAWGTSRIWRTIAITFCSTRIEAQNQLLQEWIQRSGSSLLDIYLFSEDLKLADGDLMYRVPFYQPPRETFTAICAAKDRWRTLHSPAFIHLHDHFVAGCVLPTSLHELCLSSPDAEFYDCDSRVERVPWDLQESLHLKKLDLRMINITELKINWKTITHFLHFMKELSALESFVVTNMDLATDGGPYLNETGAFSTLPNLTLLSLDADCETVGCLLSYLTAPKLKDLKLSRPHWPGDSIRWRQSVIQFFERSSYSLTEWNIL